MISPRVERGGYTLLELSMALAFFAIVGYKTATILRAVSTSSSNDNASIVLEDHAQTVLDRVAKAIMSSNRETLAPAVEAPLSTDYLRYRIQLGVEEGRIVWEDPEMIAMDDEATRVFWARNPGLGTEHRVVWTNMVRPFLEGEVMNGVDDNGNGLVDEHGLSFDIDRNAVTIRLTMERRSTDGRSVVHTIERVVTCRNPNGGGP